MREVDAARLEHGVGVYWIFERSLNFYRDYYDDVHVPPLTRIMKPWSAPDAETLDERVAVFVFRFPSDDYVEANNLRIVFAAPRTGATVLVRR